VTDQEILVREMYEKQLSVVCAVIAVHPAGRSSFNFVARYFAQCFENVSGDSGETMDYASLHLPSKSHFTPSSPLFLWRYLYDYFILKFGL
jgi:hypothetical protein